MADYDGQEIARLLSDKRRGIFSTADFSGIWCWRWNISTAGMTGDCIRLLPGGVYSLWYGCKAGTQDISVYVYPDAESAAALEVIDTTTRSRVARAVPAGTGAWEKITATFTAVARIYIVRFFNRPVLPFSEGVARCAYFDDLV